MAEHSGTSAPKTAWVTTNERTPLLQTVPVAPQRVRYPHQRTRRICTVLLLLATIALVVAFFIPFGSLPGTRPSSSWPESQGLPLSVLQDILTSTPDEDRIRATNKYYTASPHLMGQNETLAAWTRDQWREAGVENSFLNAYQVYTNYPKGHRLALYDSKLSGDKISFEARLEENVIPGDETSSHPDRIPTFHGYSASGNVTGQFVYVNYGSFQDYEDLVKANISLQGKIVIAKYGNIFRGLKVKRAQELGAVGALLYSDPGDDGETTIENGFEPYPNGPAREPSSVQRGSVQFLSFAPGDPTTPGYPSLPGAPRADTDQALPKIPSLPISYEDALPILKALNGHGPKASDFNKYWAGGGLHHKGVKYNIGPSPPELTLNLVNEQEYVTTPIWNVIGIINGTNSDEVIVVGNHRDAWIVGGAADPNSGSAALNELVRGYGNAVKKGWKPQRTIVFASWDGEEYGLVGSTEWVEEYLPWLSKSAIAYVNIDVATAGTKFHAASAPLLDDLIISQTQRVTSPNSTALHSHSLYDLWTKKIATMGSGSDFTAFQDFAGIPSMDLGFEPSGEKGAPIYHYHSNYDSWYWMDSLGDKGWRYHRAIAELWGLISSELLERPVLPFNATNYAIALRGYLDSVETKYEHSGLAKSAESDAKPFGALKHALQNFTSAAQALDARAAALTQRLASADGFAWYEASARARLWREARAINTQYKYLERAFIYDKGFDGRSWFKHTVFAPGRWTGYAGATFPPLVEAIEDGDLERLKFWVGIVEGQVEKGRRGLQG